MLCRVVGQNRVARHPVHSKSAVASISTTLIPTAHPLHPVLYPPSCREKKLSPSFGQVTTFLVTKFLETNSFPNNYFPTKHFF